MFGWHKARKYSLGRGAEARLLPKTVAAALVGVGLSLVPGSASSAQDQGATGPEASFKARALKASELTPCFIDDVARRQTCMTVTVPLDWNDPGGETIEIHAAIMRASSGKSLPDPIVVLAGGPGQAAGELASLAQAAFTTLRADRDIVLIDQRGTGKSAPLQCTLPTDTFEPAAVQAAIRECHANQPYDTRQFTMENTIKDHEAVFEALGYEQVNLWGASWGTRMAALIYRRYPERVRSMIVDGVLPPDVSLFETAPQSAERAKRKMVEDCYARPDCQAAFPDIEGQIERYIAAASRGDLVYTGPDPLTGEVSSMTMSREMAVESIRSVMYSAPNTVMLPYVIDQADKGHLAPIVSALGGGLSAADSIYVGLMISILCGEEVDRLTPRAAKAAAVGSFAEDTYYATFKNMCGGWSYSSIKGDLPMDAFSPLVGDVPTLILSGDLDPVTPPSLGEHLAQSLSNAKHIIVPGTGHNTSYVSCVPQLMKDFVDGLDPTALDASCVEHVARLPVVLGPNGQVSR